MTYFGVDSIAGSTSRGGTAALRTMLKRLRAGDCVGITPDGPRGPAMRASTGIVNIARLARAPIVPITYATSRRRVLATWDRFHLRCHSATASICGVSRSTLPRNSTTPRSNAPGASSRRRMVEMVCEAERRVGHGVALPAATDAIEPARRIAGG